MGFHVIDMGTRVNGMGTHMGTRANDLGTHVNDSKSLKW
jgi:hypothetical protein